MDQSIYKLVEQTIGRPVGTMEYCILDNWKRINYENEYIITCIHIAKERCSGSINVRYIDNIVYQHYVFYKAFVGLYANKNNNIEQTTDQGANEPTNQKEEVGFNWDEFIKQQK